MCVTVCVLHVHLNPCWRLHYVSVFVELLITFSISVYIMHAMFVQRFELQGRRFTNFHYCCVIAGVGLGRVCVHHQPHPAPCFHLTAHGQVLQEDIYGWAGCQPFISVCLSVCLPVCLSVHLCVTVSVSAYLCVSVSVCKYICLPSFLSCQSAFVSTCVYLPLVPMCLSAYLSVCLPLHRCVCM